MTEQPPDASRDPASEPPAAPLPRWVPVLIGVVLVIFGALAVFTGWRNRQDTLVRHVERNNETREERPRASVAAPPGEPDAGSSLVFPGNAPNANPAVSGPSRATMEGGPGGVTATMRLWARRGMVTNVLPEDAVVYVNDLAIGQVTQFNTMDEVYDFAAPGSYTVRLVAPGYREQQFVVTASDDAKQEIARISAKLEKQ